MSRDKRNTPYVEDNRGFMEKASKGDFASMKSHEIAEAARFPAGWVPGVGNVLDAGLAAYAGDAQAQEDIERSNRKFGTDLTKENKRRGVGRWLAEKHQRWKNRGWEAATSGAGALVGGFGAGKLLGKFKPALFAEGAELSKRQKFLKIGTHLGGAMAGGMAANMAYNAIDPRDQDPVGLVEQMVDMQQQGVQVSPAMVAAALMANLDDRTMMRASKNLKSLSGTPYFDMAVSQGNEAALMTLAQKYDAALRADTMVLPDMDNPSKLVVEQLADDINSGKLKAKNLLFRDTRVAMRGEQFDEPLLPPDTPTHIARPGLGKA